MIVLDEQLQKGDLAFQIQRWYRGKVHSVLDLRPDTIIKDEAIPSLLATENRPTFVTVNVRDFWEVVPISDKYCVVCFSVPTPRVSEIPALLRRLLRMPEFKTRQFRMGKVIRVGGDASGILVEFYDRETPKILPHAVTLPD